jgi:hypothetical protein
MAASVSVVVEVRAAVLLKRCSRKFYATSENRSPEHERGEQALAEELEQRAIERQRRDERENP